jgi:hypothetical protein
MKIGLALRDLHHDEAGLARDLRHLAERHAANHEIYHVARDLAVWSQQHVRELAPVAGRYGEDLEPEPPDEPGLPTTVRETSGELAGRTRSPALLLLRDLREVYTRACGVSVDWELVAQAAQAVKDLELLDVVQRCHPQTLRQSRWANAELKVLATQALVS